MLAPLRLWLTLGGQGSGLRLCAFVACRSLSTAPPTTPSTSETELRRRVLDKAVSLVPDHGWTRRCVEAGARTLDLPESVADLAAPRGGGDLVLYFLDDCNDRLEASLRSRSPPPTPPSSPSVMSTDLIRDACRQRLDMLLPLLPYWPAGLAVLTGSPGLASDAAARLQRLADDVCHYAGDRSTGPSWYTRRLAVGAAYASAEAFLLQDSSPGMADTWAFLERRVGGELSALLAAPGLARAACTVAVNILGVNRR